MNYSPDDGFPYYLALTENRSCDELFSSSLTFSLLGGIDETKANYRYAEGKWSIKQVVGHITDHERIMMFRTFLFSRKQPVELWGYPQNSLVGNSRFDQLPLHQLMNDFQQVRNASISFIETLSSAQMALMGKASRHDVSLEDFLKSIIGHEIHHVNILKERYF